MSLKLFSIFILCVFLPSCWTTKADVVYNATWESIDSRPLPAWYDQSKFGIFIHWGVYSVPSFGSEWFWWSWQGDHSQSHIEFMSQNYPPGFTYGDFGPQFTAEFYEPNDWADLLAASGAKYVVLTSKHHEGYTLWPSAYSFNWNAVDIGAHRDLVGDLAKAVRNRTDLHFGLYHSLFEWFNPLYVQDKANEFKTESFVNAKVIPEMVEVVNKYHPDVVWSDGDWEAPDTYWKSTDFLAWLYNESPVKDTVVTNDRWGSGVACNHGGYYTCSDHFNPGVLQPHKWENCMTIDKDSWGYVRKSPLESYRTTHELLTELISTVSCGGNLLLNIGPTHDGRILPIFEERLRQIGEWLGINGEAVYATAPWSYQNDTTTPNIWYTSKGGVVYATILSWPLGDKVYLGAVQGSANTAISLLGQTDSVFTWQNEAAGGTTVYFPKFNPVTLVSKWAWVLKLENVTPTPHKFNYPKTMSKIDDNSMSDSVQTGSFYN